MAVLCILAGEGFTKEMYEELKKEVDWEHNQPKGEIFQAIGFDNSGNYHVVDIWESEQDFKNFVTNTVKPVMDKIKGSMPTSEIIIPIHNANAFQGIDSFRVK
jgi:hypothetical protein